MIKNSLAEFLVYFLYSLDLPRLTKADLHIAPGRVIEETPEFHYRLIFEDVEENTIWVHPDLACNQLPWEELEQLLSLNFDSKHEALSYS